MRKAIAKVKLSPGNVAWYDSLTGIYLTMDSPEAIVYDDQDTKNIKNAIRYNLVSLREGCFPSQDEIKEISVVETVKEEIKPEVVKIEKEIKVEVKEEPKKVSSNKGKKGKSKKQSSQKEEIIEKKLIEEVNKEE